MTVRVEWEDSLAYRSMEANSSILEYRLRTRRLGVGREDWFRKACSLGKVYYLVLHCESYVVLKRSTNRGSAVLWRAAWPNGRLRTAQCSYRVRE